MTRARSVNIETLRPIRRGGTVTWMREGGTGIRGVVFAAAGNFGQDLAVRGARRRDHVLVFVGRTA